MRSFELEDHYDYLTLLRDDTVDVLSLIKSDWSSYFTEIQDMARIAYQYIDRRSGSRTSPLESDNELFHYPATDAIASAGGKMAADKVKNANDFTNFFSQGFLSQIEDTKGTSGQSAQNITVIVDFGDGQTKELSNRIEQVKNDRRGYTA